MSIKISRLAGVTIFRDRIQEQTLKRCTTLAIALVGVLALGARSDEVTGPITADQHEKLLTPIARTSAAVGGAHGFDLLLGGAILPMDLGLEGSGHDLGIPRIL